MGRWIWQNHQNILKNIQKQTNQISQNVGCIALYVLVHHRPILYTEGFYKLLKILKAMFRAGESQIVMDRRDLMDGMPNIFSKCNGLINGTNSGIQ